jgi:hypothetical protein
MKTDLVEIFQTIRAGIQPYASRGYTVHKNSEKEYDLFSEKNILVEGEKSTERFFVGIYIEADKVDVRLNTVDLKTSNQNLLSFGKHQNGFSLVDLDSEKLKEVLLFVEIIHTHFKEKKWI